MYKKILVPLDGSQQGQCSLDHVRAIALGCKVPEVILFRVVEPEPDQTGKSDDSAKRALKKREEQNRAEASDYISSLARRLSEEGLKARGELGFGKAGEQITEYAKTKQVDLIIMSTRGRSGTAKWEMGSVAKNVVDFSTVPVLLVLAKGCRAVAGF